MHPLHSLTSMTGRGSDAFRTQNVMSFEIPHRTFVKAVPAVILGIALLAAFTPLLGPPALLIGVGAGGGAWWAMSGRGENGLGQRNVSRLVDKRRSPDGKFFVCGVEFDPNARVTGRIGPGTVPVGQVISDD